MAARISSIVARMIAGVLVGGAILTALGAGVAHGQSVLGPALGLETIGTVASSNELPEETLNVSGFRVPTRGPRVGLRVHSMRISPPPKGRVEVRCTGCRGSSPLSHGIANLHRATGLLIPNDATLTATVTAPGKIGRWIRETHAGSATPQEVHRCLRPGTKTHPIECSKSGVLGFKQTNLAPAVRGLPQIAGSPIVNETLSCAPGTWSGTPTPSLSFQWSREHVPIAGADTAIYHVLSQDEGHLLYCEVLASNSAGSAAASSVGVTVAAHPANVALPQVTGVPTVGEMLACGPGSWSGTPAVAFGYLWLREGVPIPGANEPTYRLVAADQGDQAACRVTASNVAGSSAATSVPVLVSSLPSNLTLPQITGKPTLGETLACSSGSWSGVPSPTFSDLWLRDGVPIPGATHTTYIVAKADEGRALSCEVTARNTAGPTAAISQSVTIPSVPANTGLPTITGTVTVGSALSCSNGSWIGSPPMTFATQWQRDGAAINGANSVQYTIEEADEAHQLSCRVTALNSAGEAAALSAAVPVPEETGKPTVTSVDNTRGDLAPYAGAFDIAFQRFTARSNTITLLAAAIANPSLPPGPTADSATFRICSDDECAGPGSQVASVEADVVNYGLTRATLEASVTAGRTYYLVWLPPAAHEPTPWITFWHAGGTTIADSQEMEAAVRGFNKGSGGAPEEVISYLGTQAPPAPFSGPFEFAYQDFKAASNRIDTIGVVVGNPKQARGAVGPHTIAVRLCETPDCSGSTLATAEPFITNYGVSEAKLSPAVKVTIGKTYFVNWLPPAALSGEPWVTFWFGTGPRPEEANAMQALARGFDAEGVKFTPTHESEQVEGLGAPTFKSYVNASGEGPAIGAGSSVEVTCRVYAPQIESSEPEGFWYLLHSSPWNDQYYAVANTFFNTTGGESAFTDMRVPEC